MFTQFFILSMVRMTILKYLVFISTKKLIVGSMKRRTVAVSIALVLSALLDGATPDGWEFEYMFGHPFFFYLAMNLPVAIFVLLVALLIDNRASN